MQYRFAVKFWDTQYVLNKFNMRDLDSISNAKVNILT